MRSFVYRRKIGTSTREKLIGHYPETSIEQARMKAHELSVRVAKGENPFEPDVPSAVVGGDITFGELFSIYIERYAKHHTKKWKDTQSNYRRYFQRWVNRPLVSIRRIEVQHWVDDLAIKVGKHTANRCHDTMRAVINWGIKKDLFSQQNPCYGVDRYRLKSRDRFVQPGDEFARLAKSINEEPSETMRDFFWMCIFTGARKTNVMCMRWEQINFDLRTWRIPETKNGEPQTITLIADAMVMLQRRRQKAESEWVLGHKSLQSTAICARLTNDPVREAMEKALDAMITLSGQKQAE